MENGRRPEIIQWQATCGVCDWTITSYGGKLLEVVHDHKADHASRGEPQVVAITQVNNSNSTSTP